MNWVNFLNFIKDESNRSIEKLINSSHEYEKNLLNNFYLKSEKKSNNNDKKETKKDDKTNNKIENIQNINEKINSNFNEIINKEFGIKNIGNTCYINSTIQILLYNEIFMKNFMLNEFKIKKKDNTLSLNLWNLINSLNKTTEDSNNIVIDIREFVQYFKKNILRLEVLFKMMPKNLVGFY